MVGKPDTPCIEEAAAFVPASIITMGSTLPNLFGIATQWQRENGKLVNDLTNVSITPIGWIHRLARTIINVFMVIHSIFLACGYVRFCK